MRTPRSATTSTLAGSSSSACAPSIESSPAVSEGFVTARRGTPTRSARVSTIRNTPPERASRSPRPRDEVLAPEAASAPTSRPANAGPGRACARRRIGRRCGRVEAARRLDGHREDLERDPALDHPRHVDVAAVRALEQVPPEQQRIRVAGPRPAAWRAARRGLRRRRGRLRTDGVELRLDPGDPRVEHRPRDRERRRRPAAPATTAARRRALTGRTPRRVSGGSGAARCRSSPSPPPSRGGP